MNSEAFFLRFSWGGRRVGVEQCAAQMKEFLEVLGLIDSEMKCWQCLKGNRFVPLESMSLSGWLLNGENREDKGVANVDLGYSMTLTSKLHIDIRIKCGVYSQWVRNVCTINFPSKGEVLERVVQANKLVAISKAVIGNWEPERGVVTSHECSNLVRPANFACEGGWITYISDERKRSIKIPKCSHVERVGDGWLILATDERFSSQSPTHLQFVTALTRSLERSGAK